MNTAARPKPIGWLGNSSPSLTQRVLQPNKVRISPDLSDLKSSYHSRTGRKNLHENSNRKGVEFHRIPLEILLHFSSPKFWTALKKPLFVPAAIQFTCSNALRLKASNLETTWRLCCFGCSGCIKSSRNSPSFSPARRRRVVGGLWLDIGGIPMENHHF